MNPILPQFKLIYLLLLLFSYQAKAQQVVQGSITDSLSSLPIAYAAIYLQGTTIGTMSNEKGAFSLLVGNEPILVVSSIGYQGVSIPLNSLHNLSDIQVKLVPLQYQLSEAVIKPGKDRYTKKGNPAVEFVQHVIDRRDENNPRNKDFYTYERYEKLILAMNEFSEDQLTKGVYKNLGFLKNHIDTSEVSGKPILIVSNKELLEENYFRKTPQTEKRLITATKHDGIDEMIAQDNLQAFFGEVFKEVDIFENNISLFLQRFVSPISSLGPNFYKYYLLDTVMVDGIRCQDLGFVPTSSESFGFTGHLYVALDSTYFIKRIQLNVPKAINLNFVDHMSIIQEFERLPDHTRLLMKDDITVEFKLTGKDKGFYARRTNTYRKHSFLPPEDNALFKQAAATAELPEAKFRDEEFWKQHRHIAIPEKENSANKLMSNLRDIPLFYWGEKVISTIVAGYIPISADSSKLLVGPMNTMISGNSFEGVRLKAGAITTTALHPRWFAGGYVAYGTRDEEFKYMGQLEYSFIKKKDHNNEFPIHAVRATYTYDTDQIGQQYLFTNKDNIVLSLKRKADDRITYLRKAEIAYKREHYSGLSYHAILRNKIEYATEFVKFERTTGSDFPELIDKYQMTEAEFKIRYAKNEKFYQTRTKRYAITFEVPVFSLTHITAKKGWLGADYTYNRTEVGFDKRFWLSAFGYIDTYLKAGKVWDAVPFTMLALPNANLSYTIQPQSFALMNAVEFINDQYASWDLTYNMNGFVFNRIPIFKYLKLREVLAFKGLYGNLTDKNKPENNSTLFLFPEGSYSMGKTPYMETSFGVDNILKLIRIDYVWRLTYRDNPNIDRSGVRIAVRVAF